MDAGDDKSYDDINVTPMVDLYLVLLLIFIIMTTAGVQGVKVDLPKSSSKPAELSGPKSRAITVNSQGQVALDTVPVSLAELEAKLKEHQAKHKEFPGVIRGDRQTQYDGIMSVLDVCGRLGLTQVGLATVGPEN
jgi:biopolymer transport protein ExbD